MATSDARGAAPRMAWRVVRAVELLFVAAFTIYYCFLNLPRAAAAASSFLRVAASFAVERYAFFVANAIVIVLLALFLRDDDAFSFSAAALFSRWWPSDGDAQDPYIPSSPGPPLMIPSPGAPLMLPPPPATDTEAWEEDKEKPAVFVDKKAVHVTTVRAQAPRRSRSEKTGGGGGAACRRRAAAPELRRVESENGRQRQRAEPEVPPGIDDGEAFRRYIDAYISKQQALFQCEESAAAAAAGGGGKGGAVVAGAVVAVK